MEAVLMVGLIFVEMVVAVEVGILIWLILNVKSIEVRRIGDDQGVCEE